MKRIVSLSLGSSQQNFDRIISLGSTQFHIAHYGCDHDIELFESLAQVHDGACDVIALSCLPPSLQLGRQTVVHQEVKRLQDTIQKTSWVDGEKLRDVYMNWVLSRAQKQGVMTLEKKNVSFLSGLGQWKLAQHIAPLAQSVSFLDSYLHFQVPLVLKGLPQIQTYLRRMTPVLKRRPLKRVSHRLPLKGIGLDQALGSALEADIIVATPRLLQWVDIEALRNKTLLLDEMNETTAAALRSVGIYNVWYAQPQLAPEHGSLPLAVMEAIIMLRREHEDPLCDDDIVNFILKHDMKADLHPLYPERSEPLRKYAFVVHPLSQRDLFRHPILKPLTFLPDSWNKKVEHWLARAPGMVYGEVRGVQSEANGVQAHGLLYTLFATPREMLEAKPEDIYARLVTICEDAQKKGVSIIGLGAFTKIVGDAGLTVAKRSPVPVTTGNSLSAAATLWAARDTCARLGFITFDRAKHQKVSARAMVIGATGSIGKVCAKIVSQVFDNVVLAATNGARLMDLRQDLLDMCPETHIEITTQPDRHAGACDLIIIATSATEGGVLDIDAIKPGCVVCDVSRPLTFTAQEAMRRPDVLIIESGEIELPGQVEINCDIGLEKSVVYACLAETALLALEGRFESYTLSRNINHKKVIEIYKIAKKHGAQLAAIRSPNGVVTQQEIDLCREHAEKALKTWRSRESKDRVLLPAELHAGQ